LIKANIPYQLLGDWFTKSLLPLISCDVTMGGVVTEEQDISRDQYLDLVYSQSGTQYDLIPQAPCPSTNPNTPPSTESHVVNNAVGSVTQESTSKPFGQSKPKATPTNTTQNTTPRTTIPGKTFEVNAVQSTMTSKSQQPGSKKK
jgi:hypothetical protein